MLRVCLPMHGMLMYSVMREGRKKSGERGGRSVQSDADEVQTEVGQPYVQRPCHASGADDVQHLQRGKRKVRVVRSRHKQMCGHGQAASTNIAWRPLCWRAGVLVASAAGQAGATLPALASCESRGSYVTPTDTRGRYVPEAQPRPSCETG